jgi:hypothetical protein
VSVQAGSVGTARAAVARIDARRFMGQGSG